MATGLFPVLTTPVPVPEATTQYDEAMYWFSMAPRVTERDRADISFSIVLRPIRKLSDNTIEQAPDYMQTSYACGSMRDEAQAGNTVPRKLVKDIMALLAAYVAAQG